MRFHFSHPFAATVAVAILALTTIAGCGGGGSSTGIDPSPSPSPSPSASPLVAGRLLTVFPNEGPAAGGTKISLRTENIDWSANPLYKVTIGGVEATDLTRGPKTGDYTYLTCNTPPGTGTFKPVLTFRDASGNVTGTMTTSELGASDFSYR